MKIGFGVDKFVLSSLWSRNAKSFALNMVEHLCFLNLRINEPTFQIARKEGKEVETMEEREGAR